MTKRQPGVGSKCGGELAFGVSDEGSSMRVLLIEDDKMVGAAVEQALRDGGLRGRLGDG